MSMIPNFSNTMFPKGHDEASQMKIKRFMTIMDSMTGKELDSNSTKMFTQEPSRIIRLCKGSGRPRYEVDALLDEYKRLSTVFTKGLGKIKFPKNAKGMESLGNARQMQQQLKQMSGALPPQLMNQLGGIGGLQELMKSMAKK